MSVAEQPAHEPAGDPSMADILASIRRILSEDEPAGGGQAADAPGMAEGMSGHRNDEARDDEVLVLDHSMMVKSSDRFPASDHDRHTAEDSTVKIAPLPPADHETSAGPETEYTNMAHDNAATNAAASGPVPPVVTQPVVVPPPLPEGVSQKANWPAPAPALSDQVTVATAASSLVNLVKSVAAERTATIQRGGLSIEDVVREEVRPLLKAWLDAHLPSVVERLVQAEIERVVNRAAS